MLHRLNNLLLDLRHRLCELSCHDPGSWRLLLLWRLLWLLHIDKFIEIVWLSCLGSVGVERSWLRFWQKSRLIESNLDDVLFLAGKHELSVFHVAESDLTIQFFL